jgi:predicted RNA-binding protein associated with RNAse of E/G family
MENRTITVIKRDHAGKEVLRYTGQVIQRNEDSIRLEAAFSKEDQPLDRIELKKGDRFVETYYSDRWYNIFEIYDRDDERFKGWYCNVGYPAQIEDSLVSYRDLALDLLVYPNNEIKVLDEDEFDDLDLSEADRLKALQALKDLIGLFKKK